MPDIEGAAFSAGSSLATASWPPRLAKAAAVSPCAFLRLGWARAASSACTSSALPILAATISDVVLSSPVNASGLAPMCSAAVVRGTEPSATASKSVFESCSLSSMSTQACRICTLSGSYANPCW